jgi:hypothetical protein
VVEGEGRPFGEVDGTGLREGGREEGGRASGVRLVQGRTKGVGGGADSLWVVEGEGRPFDEVDGTGLREGGRREEGHLG